MGFFNNIKEKLKRMMQNTKTPKLNAGQIYQQEEQDPRKIEYLGRTYQIQIDNNTGENISINSIRYNNKIKYSNGSITNLMIAKIYHQKKSDDAIYIDNYEPVAFEIEEGTMIDETILQKIINYYRYEKNMPDNKECIYIGQLSQDPYDYSTKNKSEDVKRYVEQKISPEIAREKQIRLDRQNESYKERIGRYEQESSFREKIKEEYDIGMQKKNEEKLSRIRNPYLKRDKKFYRINEKQYADYEGINVENGDILRIRQLNKVCKDKEVNGTYIYTGYIQSTEDKTDAEIFSAFVPICFATDIKVEDVMQSNNPREIRNFLTLLSSEEISKNNNGYLNYIGKMNRDGSIDKDGRNTSYIIQQKVEGLKQEFYQRKIQSQQEQQNSKDWKR